MNRRFTLICLFLLGFLESVAQFTPYFKNFELSDYNGANQNWGVTIADDGMVYVSNKRGMLSYNGINWKLHELPNKTIIRSILSAESRIYTGSFEEFGYWETNNFGKLKYHSLNPLFKDKLSTNEEFWQIINYKGSIIFSSFSNVYIFRDNKIEQFHPNSTVLSISIVDDEILVSTLNGGIYKIDGLGLSRYFNHPSLANTRIISIFKLEGDVVLSTAIKGSFKIKGNDLIPLNRPIDRLIKEHQLNDLIQLPNGRQAYGTIKNGCFITDEKGNVIYHLSKTEGLLNNTVLGQYADNNHLWLALDNGLTKVNLNDGYKFFNDISGKLGAVYDVIYYNDTYYIGSNTGLFYLDDNNELQFIEGTNGQVWDLRIIENELVCGHNIGTYIVDNKKIRQISSFTGGWILKKIPDEIDKYIQGTYAGLVRFETNSDGNWNVKHLGNSTMPIKYLEFENRKTLWAANAYKGLYKFQISDKLDTITSVESYDNKGLYSQYNVRIYKIKGDVCFKTNEGWQQYAALQDSIVPFPLLDDNLGRSAHIISDFSDEEIVIKSDDKNIKFISFDLKAKPLTITSTYFQNRLIDGDEKMVKIKDSLYALNLNNGFVLIDRTKPIAAKPISSPTINTVSIENNQLEVKNLGNNLVSLYFGEDLIITASSPKSENYSLEYSIGTKNNRWVNTTSNEIEITNLKAGSYDLKIRSINEFGDVSEPTLLTLMVAPPWYNDTPGYLLLLAVILVFTFIFYRLHKRKILKEQRLLQAKMLNEQEELLKEKAIENEKQLVIVKNQSLKNELKLKSKQLANSAMALAKKNETLIGIKNDLIQTKEEFSNYYAYKNIVKKVDHSISHKDEWGLFEENFNQVHEEFFSTIKEKHLNLNPKDLRMCAYIRMGLSTKKIALLINISTRGVETHRYRLKKKLKLENGKKLGPYLRSL